MNTRLILATLAVLVFVAAHANAETLKWGDDPILIDSRSTFSYDEVENVETYAFRIDAEGNLFKGEEEISPGNLSGYGILELAVTSSERIFLNAKSPMPPFYLNTLMECSIQKDLELKLSLSCTDQDFPTGGSLTIDMGESYLYHAHQIDGIFQIPITSGGLDIGQTKSVTIKDSGNKIDAYGFAPGGETWALIVDEDDKIKQVRKTGQLNYEVEGKQTFPNFVGWINDDPRVEYLPSGVEPGAVSFLAGPEYDELSVYVVTFTTVTTTTTSTSTSTTTTTTTTTSTTSTTTTTTSTTSTTSTSTSTTTSSTTTTKETTTTSTTVTTTSSTSSTTTVAPTTTTTTTKETTTTSTSTTDPGTTTTVAPTTTSSTTTTTVRPDDDDTADDDTGDDDDIADDDTGDDDIVDDDDDDGTDDDATIPPSDDDDDDTRGDDDDDDSGGCG